jgi:hypothetical protein
MLLGMANRTSTSKRTPASKLATGTDKPVTGDGARVSINVSLPAHLHRQLRIKAITEDLSLTEAVAAAVGEWVE